VAITSGNTAAICNSASFDFSLPYGRLTLLQYTVIGFFIGGLKRLCSRGAAAQTSTRDVLKRA